MKVVEFLYAISGLEIIEVVNTNGDVLYNGKAKEIKKELLDREVRQILSSLYKDKILECWLGSFEIVLEDELEFY